MKVSQFLDILSLIVSLVLLDVEYLGLQELFEGLGCFYLHQIELFIQYVLNPKMEIPTTREILFLGSCYEPLSWFVEQRMLSHCSFICFFVSNIGSGSFRTFSV